MPSLESYTVVLRPDDNGTFVAYVPAIEGCHAWGQTQQEAKTELVNVFAMIRDEYSEEGKSLPDDMELAIAHARSQFTHQSLSSAMSNGRLLRSRS